MKFALCFLAAVVAFGPSVEGVILQGQEGCPRVVVRAAFDDPGMIDEATWWLDPWEIDLAGKFLVADVDRTGLDRLRASGFQVEVDPERTQMMCAPRLPAPGQKSGMLGFPCYRTVEETFADAEALAARYPDLVEWLDIGDSWETDLGEEPEYEGYDLMVLKLGNRLTTGVGTPADPDAKPILFVQGGLHARECPAPELLMRFAEGLVSGYGANADATWLIDEHEMHLLLFVNPDGRKRAEQGVWWRKNANNDHCSDSDLRGIDLNRNYSFLWNCCGQSSDDDCSLTFHGASGASEPETVAVEAYLRSIFPLQWNPEPGADATGIFIDLHSYGEDVYWPWFHKAATAPNWTSLFALGSKLAYLNGYIPADVPGTLDGSAVDFAYGELGVASFLFELGTAFFERCSTFESRVLPRNLDALLYAAKVARSPYATPAGPDLTTIAIREDSMVLQGEPLILEATASDARYRLVSGDDPIQDVLVIRVYLDRPPWHANPGRSWNMSPTDGAYDHAIETAELSLDTSDLEFGRHILYFQAKDADENWGAVSAEFFWIVDPTVPIHRGMGRIGP